MAAIRLAGGVTVPDDELEVRFVRSGGPGGQHVNTTATKVELRFDVEASEALDAEQKDRVRAALGNRISKDGVLVLVSSEHRSQLRNREAVEARFAALVGDALRPPPRRRRATKPSRASQERRLQAKRHRSEKKALRRSPDS